MRRYVLKMLLFLELVLLLAGVLGKNFIALRAENDTFLGAGLGEFGKESLIAARANFDGFYYAKIAKEGYQYLQEAFFPFYPRTIKFFQPVFGSFILSGLFVSHFCFILAIYFLLKLFSLENGKSVVRKTILLLILFPTAFYFLSVYTESLFLLLAVLSFWFAKKEKWFLAGIFAAIAANTRLIGIFIWPALIVECWEKYGFEKTKNFLGKAVKNCFSLIILPPLGLIHYMWHLQQVAGDPFMFIKVQPSFGAERSVTRITPLYQVFWRYLKMIFTVDRTNPIYFTIWLEFLLALLFLFLLCYGWVKKKELKISSSYLIFATLSYMLPTLTGTFSSLPRYVLLCFPCFLILAKVIEKLTKKLKRIETVWWVLSGLLLLLCATLFFRGYWIA